MGAGSRQEWLNRFRDAEALGSYGQELDHQHNRTRKHVVAVFGGIDASLARSVERFWGEVADALRVKLTEAIVPTGPETGQLVRVRGNSATGRSQDPE